MRISALLVCLALGFLPAQNSTAGVTQQQIDQLASHLVTVNRLPLSGQIVVDSYRSSGFAAIEWHGTYATIYVDPIQMRKQSLNTWAFVIGHELGHQILGHRSTGPIDEASADIYGARLAINAGYNVSSFIKKIYSDPNSCSLSHGCWHSRAYNLERTFCSRPLNLLNANHCQHRVAALCVPSFVY